MSKLQLAILRLCEQRRLTADQLAASIGTSPQSVRVTLRRMAERGQVHVVRQERGAAVWAKVQRLQQMRHEVDEARRVARMREWLMLWERYMRSVKFSLGFPAVAAGFAHDARIRSWEDVDDEQDKTIVEAVDAAVDSLPHVEREAVYRWHNLSAVWPHRESVDEMFRLALSRLMGLVDKRIPVSD